MKRLLLLLVVPLFGAASVVPAAAQDGRPVQCTVTSAGQVEFDGTCMFSAEGGGSFSLANVDPDAPLYGEVSIVSVTIVSPGTAEVSGLTIHGINSRWGEATRSRADGACWTGADFEVCAH